MKKLVSIVATVALVVGLAGCGNKSNQEKAPVATETVTTTTDSNADATTEGNAVTTQAQISLQLKILQN